MIANNLYVSFKPNFFAFITLDFNGKKYPESNYDYASLCPYLEYGQCYMLWNVLYKIYEN